MSAHPLRPARALAALLGVVVLLGADAPDHAPLEHLEAGLHREVNAVRARHGLVPLRRDAELDAVARAHSADMAHRGYLAHESPEGVNPAQRLVRAGLQGFTLAGENVGLTNLAPPNQEILRGWLASPIHRRNLLAPAFNATGLGIAPAPDGTLYYTQLYLTYPR